MARALLIMLISFTAHAQFLGFGGGSSDTLKSRLPELTEKLKGLEMKLDPQYEDAFNQGVKAIENGVEEEKLYCSGEAVDEAGKLVPAGKKQLCMRELKKQYLEAMGTIFEQKRKYLDLIHTRQQERLSETHAKLKATIEKSF